MSDKPLEFKIFSGMLRAYESEGRKRISTVASSTVTDHYGDEITPECIQGMSRSAVAKAMTIFLNHSYTVPEDVFGRTAASEAKLAGTDPKTGAAVWDMGLDVEVDETNPRAVQTYRSLRGPNDDGDGQKLGVSIGALIKDYELKDPKDPWSPMRIKDVELLEASIVGIPANPRSWVKSAVRAYKASFERTDDKNPAVSLGVDLDALNEAVDRIGPNDPDDLPEGPVLPEVAASIDPDPIAVPVEETEPVIETDKSATPDEERPTADVELQADSEEAQPESSSETAEIERSVDLVLDSLTRMVREQRSEINERDAQINRLTRERDEALQSLRLSIRFVEKLARTPLGKKTQFAAPISDFRSKFAGVYDEEFLKFLENKNES